MKKRSAIPEYLSLLKGKSQNLPHGSFSSLGGFSKAPYASNNIGLDLGDDQDLVLLNRVGMKEALGITTLASAHQVHGVEICHVREPIAGDTEFSGYDALTTDQPEIGLVIQHADCQGVVIHDPVKNVIAAVHSGWRGSVANILAATVSELCREYGSNSADLHAGVGPSLGPCCAEFINHKEELPPSFQEFQCGDNHFNFWRISRSQLEDCGVRPDNISISGVCTSCSADYFSYRRACREDNGVTGRNATIIALSRK